MECSSTSIEPESLTLMLSTKWWTATELHMGEFFKQAFTIWASEPPWMMGRI